VTAAPPADAARLRAAGSSPAAIRQHYDLSDDFFRLWLGDDLVYSCAEWDDADPRDTLERAQQRKLDRFAGALGVPGARVLDVGCGWGALLDRFVRRHGAAGGVGIALSPAQVTRARARQVPGVDYRLEHWADHRPASPYDVVTCIEATEHFASGDLDVAAKVEVYRAFFARLAGWLHDGGRVGLQLICQDDVGPLDSRGSQGPVSRVIGQDIFPEAMPASLAELAVAWETDFRLDSLQVAVEDYVRTFGAWGAALRDRRDEALGLVGPDVLRTFERYVAACRLCFRLRQHTLYRVLLTKRARPKSWAVPPALPTEPTARLPRQAPVTGASAAAVRAHYDVSNEFYALWLGPTMMYSSGLWGGPAGGSLDAAVNAKIDYFVARAGPASRVLDVGCGWGHTARRLTGVHGVRQAVGLTLSDAQAAWCAERAAPGCEVRVESWETHAPASPYDAVFSFGAFEHFARPGSTSPERVQGYRRFFGRCFQWLGRDGRLLLETIAHDDAPDTPGPGGSRGPVGDAASSVYPESVCPQLCEIVAGFEPWFRVEVLRSDPADFARTCRAWWLALRAHEEEARALVGDPLVRVFRRYLASSELQFRTGAITNYRFVLHRRPEPRH
jgi:cyclopropane-fatty-acyl-phospholipid synthase